MIFLDKVGKSFNDGNSEFNWLVSDCVVSEIVLGNNWLEKVEEILEVLSEELRFNFSDFIEFNEDIFKDGLIILLKSLNGDLSH